MTVREFINTVTQNPNLLDLDVGVVISTLNQDGGEFDGGVWAFFRPVQTVMVGDGELLFWINPNPDSQKKHIFMTNFANWPDVAVFGPMPDSLKR